MSVRYLTGSTSAGCEAVARERGIGLMVQPRNCYQQNIEAYPAWAADNGTFCKAPGRGGFDATRFRRMLARDNLRRNAASCLFVVAPDCLRVLESGDVMGDAVRTLAQFEPWAVEIRAAGFPVALVAQNGLETMLGGLPWALVDVLFIGGDKEWKLGPGAMHCISEAQRHGKRTHIGRVNSLRRLRHAHVLGVDSADGTFLGFAPDTNLPRMLRWLDGLKQESFAWGAVQC